MLAIGHPGSEDYSLPLNVVKRETGIRSNGIRSNRQIGIRSKGNHLENKI